METALALGAERVAGDPDLLSRLGLARIRVLRRLLPVDRAGDLGEHDWALLAVLHDLLYATHPRVGHRKASQVFDEALEALKRIPAPFTVAEALDRHGWFSRVLEITRSDTHVAWWIGSRTFAGLEPPARLLAWRKVRRVEVEKRQVSVFALADSSGGDRPAAFFKALGEWLAKTPLTDLATAGRKGPELVWTAPSIGLLATRCGRPLARRALSLGDPTLVDRALGRATRALVGTGSSGLGLVLRVLADRHLHRALERRADAAPDDDALFARQVGAWAAVQLLEQEAEVAIDPRVLRAEVEDSVWAKLDGVIGPLHGR
jgi:hypothetical protein